MRARLIVHASLAMAVGAPAAVAQESSPANPPASEQANAPPPAASAPAAPAEGQTLAFDDVHFTPPPGDTVVPGTPAAPPVTFTPAAEVSVKAEPKPGASGWMPGEGFVLRSDDGNYKLRIGLQSAYKFEPVYQEGDYGNRRAFFVLRPIFAGTFFKEWIRFWTSLELVQNPPYLLDSYVEVQPRPEIGVRMGQQYTLISRHEQFGPQQILFPEWAPVAEYFWTGRDKGVTAWGTALANRIEYYAGAYSGTPLRQYQVLSGNYVIEARAVWNPLGATGATEFPYILEAGSPFRVSTSLQGYYGKVQLAQENFNPSSFRFDVMATGDQRKQTCGAADIYMQGRFFAGMAEAYVRETTPDVTAVGYTSIGMWGQIGFMFWPRTMDVGVRVNWLDPSTKLSNDNFISGEGQIAYYVTSSPNLVIKLRYGYAEQHSPGMAALGAVPLVLAAGTTQLFTAQLNLAF